MKVTEVVDLKKYESGKLCGFCNVLISLNDTEESHMKWTGFKLFKGDEHEIEIALPDKEGADKEGKKTWYKVITIDREGDLGKEFFEHIRSTIEQAYLAENGEKTSAKKDPSPKKKKFDHF